MDSIAIYETMNQHDLDEIQTLRQHIQQLSNNIDRRTKLIESMKEQTNERNERKPTYWMRVGRA